MQYGTRVTFFLFIPFFSKKGYKRLHNIFTQTKYKKSTNWNFPAWHEKMGKHYNCKMYPIILGNWLQ